MIYKYCSICGGRLRKRKDGYLACIKCSFVNYRNPRPTATALVLYKNKLLLTKRAKKPFVGWWDLPGGFIDRGESAEQALKRELKEETGINVKIKIFFGTYPGSYFYDSDKFNILAIVYLVQGSGQQLKALDDVCESRWFSKKEIPKKIAFDSNQKIIKDFFKYGNKKFRILL